MKNLHNKSVRSSLWKDILLPIFTFLFVFILIARGFLSIEQMNRLQTIDLTRQALKRATLQCYAIEGAYPPDVDYLENNYNITIDHDKYFIFFDNFASNIMPTIEVYEKY